MADHIEALLIMVICVASLVILAASSFALWRARFRIHAIAAAAITCAAAVMIWDMSGVQW